MGNSEKLKLYVAVVLKFPAFGNTKNVGGNATTDSGNAITK
jgi:hypothetical protein